MEDNNAKATEVTTTKRGRKVTVITQQIMQNRIRRATLLRRNYHELADLITDPTTSDRVRKVLNASANETFIALQKSERKVCVAVQKMLADDYSAAVTLFDSFIEMWPSDPSVTVIADDSTEIPSDDDETEEDEKE